MGARAPRISAKRLHRPPAPADLNRLVELELAQAARRVLDVWDGPEHIASRRVLIPVHHPLDGLRAVLELWDRHQDEVARARRRAAR